MKRILGLIIGITFSFAFVAKGQQETQLSHYYMAIGHYNPAYAGSSTNLNLFALSRLQYVGVPDAPKSFLVTADLPFNFEKIHTGLGLSIYSESIGLFNTMHFAAQFAYRYKILGGILSAGLQLGVVSQTFDGTQIDTPDETEDEALPTTEVTGSGLDINAGIYYQRKNLYMSIAATHLNQPDLTLGEKYYSYIPASYNFIAGYNIQLQNSLFELKPSVFVLTDLTNFYTDLTARMEYNKMFNGGIAYRINNSVALLVGARLGRFEVGYSYGIPTTSFVRATTGSHELMIRYRFKLHKTNTGHYKHKSVRIL